VSTDSDNPRTLRTDSDIFKRAEQTPQAFAEVFDRHASSVESFLRRRLGASAAEDALSETFLTAFQRRSSFDHSWESARPWLLGIAARVAARHRAAEAKHWRAIQAATYGGEFTSSGGIDEAIGRMDASSTIRALAPKIAALSAKERDTLLLYAWSDLTPEEIAQALRIPMGTVRSRLHRIRKKLAPSGAEVIPLTRVPKEMNINTRKGIEHGDFRIGA
jgi:RNA polymerase sigma-70 factor (ECF subfamily)